MYFKRGKDRIPIKFTINVLSCRYLFLLHFISQLFGVGQKINSYLVRIKILYTYTVALL